MTRNYTLVCITPGEGLIRRYVTGKKPLLTHEATAGVAVTFTPEIVESFMIAPHENFRIHHEQPDPPPPAGGTPVAARVALAA